MPDILVTSPFQPFTLPTQFKAVFNGYIYCGTVDAVDPSVSQVQVYLVNESGDKVPVAQPLRTNAGGFLVYNGQPSKFVTNSNHSLLVRDSLGAQVWYEPDMAVVDPKTAIDFIFDELAGDHGANLVNWTPNTIAGLTKQSVEHGLRQRKMITDLGAASGVASAAVDAKVVAAVAADYAIALPSEFNYVTAGTLNMPSLKPVIFLCPDGRAKMSSSVSGLMLESINTFKFQGSYFKNIDFVGADKQNSASRWMYAEEGKYTANFITEDCSWDGFHTVSKASCIGVKHYRPKYYGCGDTGAVVDSYHWTTSLFSSFNLNEWHEPTFIGKFGTLLKILGGYNNYIYNPWFEKVETVTSSMIVMRQHYNVQIIGGWLENFKTQFLFNLDGDGTENTQSDICVIDGLHINNNWSLDPAHSDQASGFVALFNRLTPAFTGNQYDTKFVFRNIMEHPDSVVGWALTRTGSTLNLASSLHEIGNLRLKSGHPAASDGMSLSGNGPDLRRHFRDLSSNKFDLAPGNFGIFTFRNANPAVQKSMVMDDSGETIYWRRGTVKLVEASTNYFAPGVANAVQCGVTTRPWSGGFTQTAFTVTSDENHKTPAQAIMDKLLDAWAEVQFVTYQFLDRVEMKGPDGARWHFGVVAQRVVEALERHGLIWGDYAFICLDKWDASPATYDDDGNMMTDAIDAGEKFGIRYEEALVLEAALQRRNYNNLLYRIEKLESK